MIRNPPEFLDCADQDVIKGWVSISARGTARNYGSSRGADINKVSMTVWISYTLSVFLLWLDPDCLRTPEENQAFRSSLHSDKKIQCCIYTFFVTAAPVKVSYVTRRGSSHPLFVFVE